MSPDNCELMFWYVGQICFRLGFNGPFVADDVTMVTIVVAFSVISWLLLGRWRHFRQPRGLRRIDPPAGDRSTLAGKA